MTLTEWDKLWEPLLPMSEHNILSITVEEWKAIKVEGDRLQEKAKLWNIIGNLSDLEMNDLMTRLENLDKIEREWLEMSMMMGRKIIEHQGIAEAEIAWAKQHKQKLEAIREIMKGKCDKYDNEYCEDKCFFWDNCSIRQTWEVLGE